MAGRGGPKLKEYRQHVTSVRHWLKEIEYEGLIVCEVYCGAFGNCQVILPTINSVMLAIDDAEDKIKWLVINVAKLEEEQRHLLADEEKKKAEMESVQRRKALNDKEGDGEESTANALAAAHQQHLEEEETAAKIKTAWDKITIPKLEKYSGYDHPRPLWLLMKDGQVLYELNSANPPKMMKMVTSIIANTPLTESELSAMDFHPDPNAKKRKKKPSKKAVAAAAAREARKAKLARRAARPEAPHTDEYLLHVRIADIHKNVADTTGKHPLLVLYVKDSSSDDFTYYGQTERIRGELNPVYHKSFAFPKEDVQPQLDAGHDIELKFVLYDSDTDVIHKDHLPTILGDAYLHLGALLGETFEGGSAEIKLKKHVPHSAADKKKKKDVEHPEEEDGAGLLTVLAKPRSPVGVVTQYQLHLAATKLPSLLKDSVGVAPEQPVLLNEDGSHVDPALLAEHTRFDYFVEFQLSDDNSLRPASVGITENVHGAPEPVFAHAFSAPHYSKDDRTLTFMLYDGLAVDERFFDGLTNGLAYRKELVATASVRYESFLLQRKQFKNLISLPWLDAAGQQLNGDACLILSADEYNDDGTLEPFDPDEYLHEQKEAPPEKLELAISLVGLERDGPSHKQPLIAVFVQTTSGAFEFLGQTERAPPTDDVTLSAQYSKTFLVLAPRPVLPQPIHAVSDEISADTSYASFSNPSLPSTPRPGSNRTNIYKFVLYDSEGDDYAKGASDLLGESTIELSKELLAMGATHSLTLLDKTATPHPSTTLSLNIQPVGAVSAFDVALTAGGLVKVAGNSSSGLLPNPLIKVYSSHKTLGNALVLEGETERILASTDPSFLGKVQLAAYSAYQAQVTVVVYDAPTDSSTELTDEHIIGEASFKLSDFVQRSAASAAASASGQPQPVEFKLVRLVKSEDPSAADTNEEVNGGAAFIRLCDVTPKPIVRKKKLDENGEEVSDDEQEDLEAQMAAAALAAQKVVDGSSKELTAAERELGTSSAMADGSKLALSVSARDIAKRDWLNKKCPLAALFKKSPATGHFELVDATERIPDDQDPKWQKTFILDNPQGSQFYKVILLDAPRTLTPEELAVWAGATAVSRPGVPEDEYASLTLAGGDAEHLGEVVFDVQKLLIRAEGLRVVDRTGADVANTHLNLAATEVGTINALQLHLAATGLPKSELFGKTDAVAVLSVRNGSTGDLVEVARSERLANEANPKWTTPLAIDGFSKTDRHLRLAVYDADADPNLHAFTERDLLGEAATTLNHLLSGPVDLKLIKAGEPVLVGEAQTQATLQVRAAARGGISITAAAIKSLPPSRPQSAIRRPTSAGVTAAGSLDEAQVDRDHLSPTSAVASKSRPQSAVKSRPVSAVKRPASSTKSRPTSPSKSPSRPQSAVRNAVSRQPSTNIQPAAPASPKPVTRPASGVKSADTTPAAAAASRPQSALKQSRPQSAVRQLSSGVQFAATPAADAAEAAAASAASSSTSRPVSRPQSAVRTSRPASGAASPSSPTNVVAAAPAGTSRPPSAGAAAVSASASRPTSRPVSAKEKLDANLAAKDAEAHAAAVAASEAAQAAATPAEAVEAAAHHEPSVAPPAAAEATTSVPTPGGVTSATATDAAHEEAQ